MENLDRERLIKTILGTRGKAIDTSNLSDEEIQKREEKNKKQREKARETSKIKIRKRYSDFMNVCSFILPKDIMEDKPDLDDTMTNSQLNETLVNFILLLKK